MVRITGIEESSPLLSLGVRAGDTLVAVNKNEIRDVLDYRFYITDRNITLSLVREDGEEYEVFLRKREYDDVGLEFETPLMDKKHTCKNKCIFCFVTRCRRDCARLCTSRTTTHAYPSSTETI